MVNFNSYVSLPEGIYEISPLLYGIKYGLYMDYTVHPSMNLLSIFGITKLTPTDLSSRSTICGHRWHAWRAWYGFSTAGKQQSLFPLRGHRSGLIICHISKWPFMIIYGLYMVITPVILGGAVLTRGMKGHEGAIVARLISQLMVFYYHQFPSRSGFPMEKIRRV